MKKWDIRKIKIRPVRMEELNDRLLLINLYVTQLVTLIVGLIILLFQKNALLDRFSLQLPEMLIWGIGLAAAVLVCDFVVGQFVPDDVSDDGGINEMMFAGRPLWHIALLCLVVAFCEEILFRGAIQHALGPYWTSILFAAIHVRYLQSWLMTGLVFSISYAMGFAYIATGTLWTPIIAHFLIDFVMGCIIRFNKKSDATD